MFQSCQASRFFGYMACRFCITFYGSPPLGSGEKVVCLQPRSQQSIPIPIPREELTHFLAGAGPSPPRQVSPKNSFFPLTTVCSGRRKSGRWDQTHMSSLRASASPLPRNAYNSHNSSSKQGQDTGWLSFPSFLPVKNDDSYFPRCVNRGAHPRFAQPLPPTRSLRCMRRRREGKPEP